MTAHLKLTRVLVSLLALTLVLSGCAMLQTPPTPASPTRSTVVVEREVLVEPAAELAAAPAEAPYPPSTGGTANVNDEPYDAVFYQNYGVNPFIDTEDDHLSTFAMDVDNASYTVARRYVLDGYLPDPDSVRVEEFVNYFNHHYEQPNAGAFAIHLDGSPAPFGGEKYWLMRVGLQGRVVAPEARKDATLIFVIDVSGSMDMDNRLGLVKRSLRLLVDELRPSDAVGIVVYGSQGRVVLEPTSAENKTLIMQAIDSLYSEGSTNAEEGLQLGYRLAAEHAQPERITRIILCSDGVANVGNTGPDSILRTIRSYVDQGVTLSTVGFGMDNFNDVLMEQLANDGDGNYYYVDTLNEARRVFVENLTGTLQVIAKDAKVQVDFDPAVVSRYRLLGYENRAVRDEQFRDDTVDAGEVGAGHSVTALYEVKFHDAAAGPAATVYIRYQDPDTGEVIEQSAALAREDFRPTFAEMAPRFQLDAAVAEYAEILRNSYWAQDGSLSAVRQLAQQVSAALPDDADVTEFAFLVSQAERIQQRQ
jgi:Ca-activated chloride channel family protein